MDSPTIQVKNSFLHYFESDLSSPQRRTKSEILNCPPLTLYDIDHEFEPVSPEHHLNVVDIRRSSWSSCTGVPERHSVTTLSGDNDRGVMSNHSIATGDATGDEIPCPLRQRRYSVGDNAFGGCRRASTMSTPVSRDTRTSCSMSSRPSNGGLPMASTGTAAYCRSASPDEFQDWQTTSTLNPSDHRSRPSPEEFGIKFGRTFIEAWYQRREDQGISPDSYAFHAVLAASAIKGDVKRCSDWFYHMEQCSSTVMDVQSYMYVLQACGKAGDSQAAFIWFESLREFMGRTEAPTQAYNAVIEACGKDCKPELAEAWFIRLQTQNACDGSSYNYIALAWALAGNVPKTEAWYSL
eukprot:GEMP01056300.1.p1 GENE.GEMP01056300.1~~GEMP01056300.1.p1  ORF type:complete len:376 (+),score=20.91 GEMP01056300.1:74-1129(+)